MHINFFLLITLLYSCATTSPLKPIKAEGYNKKIKDVLILTTFEVVPEVYENDLVLELRKQFSNDNIKNSNFSYGKMALNKDEKLNKKMSEFKPKYVMEINETVKRSGSYGTSIRYLIKLTDIMEKSEVWQLDVWGAGDPKQFGKDIYLALMKSNMINAVENKENK